MKELDKQKVKEVKSQDGVKFVLGDDSWLLFRLSGTEPILRIYSEATSQVIDEEVRTIIENAYIRTKELLTERRHELEVVAKELLEKEVLQQEDLTRLVGKRPFDNQTNYQAHMAGTDRSETESEVKGEQAAGGLLGSDLPDLHLPGLDDTRTANEAPAAGGGATVG